MSGKKSEKKKPRRTKKPKLSNEAWAAKIIKRNIREGLQAGKREKQDVGEIARRDVDRGVCDVPVRARPKRRKRRRVHDILKKPKAYSPLRNHSSSAGLSQASTLGLVSGTAEDSAN